MKGVVLFAFNSPTVDYFRMAVFTAKRCSKFLQLPVTVITDNNTNIQNYENVFDKIIYIESDKSNFKNKEVWINKGRHRVYDLSPYDETLVIDVDYLINSNHLSKFFNIYDDFICFKDSSFLLYDNANPEMISIKSYQSVWATAIAFRKTEKVKTIFQLMESIEKNYDYYVKLHNILGYQYRNDFALTIALNTIEGQIENPKYYAPWKLLHVNKEVTVYRHTDTTYYAMNKVFGKEKLKYCILNDTDFHCLNKETFMELMNE